MSDPVDTGRLMSLALQHAAAADHAELKLALDRLRETLTFKLENRASDDDNAEASKRLSSLADTCILGLIEVYNHRLSLAEVIRLIGETGNLDTEGRSTVVLLLSTITRASANTMDRSRAVMTEVAEFLNLKDWQIATIHYLYNTHSPPGAQQQSSATASANVPITAPSADAIVILAKELAAILITDDAG